MNCISTDVDKILDYVKGRRKAELIEVSRALSLKPMEVDKWSKILEKEGFVQIEYNLTKMYIIWAGPDSMGEHAFRADEPSHSKPIIDKIQEAKKRISEQQKFKSPEKAKTQIVSPKEHASPEMQEAQAKPKPSAVQPTKASAAGLIPKILKPKQGRAPAPAARQKGQYAGTSAEMQVDLGRANELSLLLKNKVEAINSTVAEISEVKAEREKLHGLEYAPLISRFDSHLSSLGEKLAEREAAVLELRKRIIDLPNTVAKTEIELRDSSKSLEEIESEYSRQLSQLSKMKGEISGVREEIKSELSLSKNAVKACIGSLSTIEEGIESVNTLKEQAMQRIGEAQVKIEEERTVIERMAALVDGSQMQVDELREMLDGVMARAREADRVIGSLELQKEKLDEAEEAMRSLEESYSGKKDGLRRLAESQEAELNAMRVEIEKGFLHKYLSEVSRLAEEHSAEAEDIIRRDEDLELRLKTARERLQQLLKESRELSKKFEESV